MRGTRSFALKKRIRIHLGNNAFNRTTNPLILRFDESNYPSEQGQQNNALPTANG
jgi:hypothetical protein